jgi:hypothetical protein
MARTRHWPREQFTDPADIQIGVNLLANDFRQVRCAQEAEFSSVATRSALVVNESQHPATNGDYAPTAALGLPFSRVSARSAIASAMSASV